MRHFYQNKKERKDDKRIRHRGTRDDLCVTRGIWYPARCWPENICTNPARVRKVMAQLKRAGLVETHEGAVGGYRFEGSADTVTLCDIAQAVGAAFVSASWRSGDVDKPCLVASGMGALMDEVYTGLNTSCKERLQSVTVAALEARLFDGKPLAGPCGRAKKEKAAAAHGGAK